MADASVSIAFQRRLEKLEPLAALALGLHGAAMLLYQGGGVWQAGVVAAVALVGVLGLAGWRGTHRTVLVRLAVLLAAAWLLMGATGGTGSYFLVWYFVLVPVYALLLPPRQAAVLVGLVCVSYLSLLALPVPGVPLVVVGVRTVLLVFIGWMVQAVGAATRRETEERLRAEHTARTGEERFHLALDAAAMGAWDWDIASGAVSWTDNVEGIFDLPGGAFGQTYEAYLDLVHPEDRARVRHTIGQALETGDEYAVEHRVRRADGTLGWIGGRGRVFFDDDGRPVRMAGTVTDITAFKTAEEEREQLFGRMQAARARAEEAEQRLAQILERITDAFVALDTAWRYTYVNEKAAQIFNRSRQDLLGKHIWSEFPGDVGSSFYQACHRAVEQQATMHLTDYYAPLGCWFDNYLYPSPDGLSIFFRDITEQKQAEEALQDSEEKYRNLFETASDAIFIVEVPTARLLKANGRAAQLVGYTEDELHSLTVFDLDPPEDRPRIEAIIEEVLEVGSALFEHRLVCKDGAEVPVEISTRRVAFEGRPALQSFVRDITERKRAEAALRQSQERLNGILQSLDDVVWSFDVQAGRIVYISPAAEVVYGHPPADFLADPQLWLKLVHPSDRKRVARGSAAEVEDGSCNLEYRIMRPDGEVRWVHDRSHLVFDEAGTALRRDGIVTDITERKQVAAALRASEELNRRVVEALPGGIVQVSVEGEILYANAEAQRILGLSFDRLSGSYVADFETQTFWEDGSPCPVEAYPVTQCLQTGAPQPPATIGVRRPDGTMTWAVFTAVPLIEPQTRQLSGAVVTFLDLTERKRAEEALRQNEARLAEAQRIAHLGNWEWDLRADTQHWSDELHRIYGLDPEAHRATYATFLACVHPEDRPRVEAVTQAAQAGTPRVTLEYRVLRPDGAVRMAWSEARTFFDDDGTPVRMAGTVLDLTERKRAEAAALQAQEELLRRQQRERERVETELEKVKGTLVRQTRLATIGQVAASIAHELRNPLGAVRNANYYLRGRLPTDDAKWSQYLDIIEREVATAEQIISDLLEMSRPQASLKEPLDLREAAQQAFAHVQGTDAIRFECGFDPDPFTVFADPVQLGQVLLNLFTNAVQAIDGPGCIALEARREEDFDLITVRDDGRGIDEAERAQVFEPLFTTKARGTGLGLAICRQIVERHGGTIEVSEAEGAGAALHLRLPRQPADVALTPQA